MFSLFIEHVLKWLFTYKTSVTTLTLTLTLSKGWDKSLRMLSS